MTAGMAEPPSEPGTIRVATYRLRGGACPQLLLRVLGLPAQQGLVPERITAERDGDDMVAEMRVGPLGEHRAAIIAAKLAAIIDMVSVELVWSTSDPEIVQIRPPARPT